MNNRVRRPVRPSDFAVLFVGFFHNLTQSFEVFTGELLDIAIHHAKYKTEQAEAWEEMANDLETIQEETNG